ncbi:hypothetical protein PSACC_01920 [Paramicrosporidium saccamoebae]|uniref:Anaphase-promoting complex subunit 2 n=1 Tax=Paramicrosporidium saccamoebae TaxID=1246581 RepID=A0A2H9TKE8_9FUNG|nr:hypothetical protein PSACC_01920 [Paramicrosporidium saccamoebae]
MPPRITGTKATFCASLCAANVPKCPDGYTKTSSGLESYVQANLIDQLPEHFAVRLLVPDNGKLGADKRMIRNVNILLPRHAYRRGHCDDSVLLIFGAPRVMIGGEDLSSLAAYCDFAAENGETLAIYVKRMNSYWKDVTGALPDTLFSVQQLLPIHSKMMRTILDSFYSEYCRAIEQLYKGADACVGDEKEFYEAAYDLKLLLHFESEAIPVFYKSVMMEHNLLSNEDPALAESQLWSGESPFGAFGLPDYLKARWIEQAKHYCHKQKIAKNAGRIFDYIIDYPNSELEILQLHRQCGSHLDITLVAVLTKRTDGSRAVLQVLLDLYSDPDYQDTLMNLNKIAFDGTEGAVFEELPTNWTSELEICKAKLPSGNWAPCEVMLRDYETSMKQSKLGTNVLILSHLYWPLSEPAGATSAYLDENLLKSIATNYSKTHQSRELRWKPDLSRVSLEIEFETGSVSFTCSDAQACVLMLISDGPWEVQRLFDKLENQFSAEMGRSSVEFWIRKRVVHMTDGTISLYYCDALIAIGYSAEDRVPALPKQDDEMEKYWSYITAMMTNIGELKLDRIHAMLGMFASDYRCTSDSLAAFLNGKVREGLLLVHQSPTLSKHSL